ncbi:MAG: regulator of chromosome condensation [Labilithrix sp.]|nr:regulator of chromosome condensation [Labilithrix sp.]
MLLLMRTRARRFAACAVAAYALIACSVLTDYSLKSDPGTTPTPEGGSLVDGRGPDPGDSSSLPDATSIVDADPGPMCTQKPCIVQIAAAVQNTCARIDDGKVKCWGWNNTGVVGSATKDADFPTPQSVALAGPADEIAIGGWPLDYATACARRGAGVDCWGADGASKMLGRSADAAAGGDFFPDPAPVAGFTGATGEIAVGSQRVCARTGAFLQCWGTNYAGDLNPTPVPFNTPKPVKQIAGARAFHCALLDSEEVACAGNIYWYDPLWNAMNYGRGPGSVELQIVSGVSGIAQIATQGMHVCALTKTGGVLCWGRNSRGQLGRGTNEDKADVPAAVTLPKPAKFIATGANHTCAILTDDTVWCWGANSTGNGKSSRPFLPRGQVGTLADGGLDDFAPTPRKVLGLPAGVTRTLALGYAHTCALEQDGAVYCWGKNEHGQLGLGSVDDTAHATPARVVF